MNTNLHKNTENRLQLSLLDIKDIRDETCITDTIQVLMNNASYRVLLYLALLGTLIKLYDNIMDWKLIRKDTVTYDYTTELLKYCMITICTLTFLTDSGSVYGILALHILCLKNNEHGFDEPFFNIGIVYVGLVALYHLQKEGITMKNMLELIGLACIGYMETLLFKEEISDIKITTRIFVVFILILFVYLDISGFYSVFSKNVVQLFVCGIFYLGTDIMMNIYLYFMHPTKYINLKM